jgi:hypothetical protein
VRRVWGLPRDSSNDLLYLISNSLPIFYQLCRHVINFVQKCGNSESPLVLFIVKHGIFFALTFSPIGRNCLFCSQRYGVSLTDLVIHRVPQKFFNQFFQCNVSDDLFTRAIAVLELIFVRDDAFRLSDDFSRLDISAFIFGLSRTHYE